MNSLAQLSVYEDDTVAGKCALSRFTQFTAVRRAASNTLAFYLCQRAQTSPETIDGQRYQQRLKI